MRILAERQRDVMAGNRFGIPAQAHEEVLTGLAVWGATIYPAPLSWAASFDPALVERMAARIARSMRQLGIHQGLAPVLDVVRDHRWGRVEETLGEDPFLVGLVGSAYVRGLEEGGTVSTLKHFLGYSASRAARNLAPVSIGPRELADVILPPFEMALRAGARSVMNSYTDLDGVPVAADPHLLSDLLRDQLGFDGHRRGRLLLGGIPGVVARCRRVVGRSCRTGAERGDRHRTAVGQRVRRAAPGCRRRRDRR